MESQSITIRKTGASSPLIKGYTRATKVKEPVFLETLTGIDEYSGISFETDVTIAGETLLKSNPYAGQREVSARFSVQYDDEAVLRAAHDTLMDAYMDISSVELKRVFYGSDGKGIVAKKLTGFINAVSEWERKDTHAFITVDFLFLNPRLATDTLENLPEWSDGGEPEPEPDWTAVNAKLDSDVSATRAALIAFIGSGVDEQPTVAQLEPLVVASDDNEITLTVSTSFIQIYAYQPRSGYTPPIEPVAIIIKPAPTQREVAERLQEESASMAAAWWAANPDLTALDMPTGDFMLIDDDAAAYSIVEPASYTAVDVIASWNPGDGQIQRLSAIPVFSPSIDGSQYLPTYNRIRSEAITNANNWKADNPLAAVTPEVISSLVESIQVPTDWTVSAQPSSMNSFRVVTYWQQGDYFGQFQVPLLWEKARALRIQSALEAKYYDAILLVRDYMEAHPAADFQEVQDNVTFDGVISLDDGAVYGEVSIFPDYNSPGFTAAVRAMIYYGTTLSFEWSWYYGTYYADGEYKG